VVFLVSVNQINFSRPLANIHAQFDMAIGESAPVSGYECNFFHSNDRLIIIMNSNNVLRLQFPDFYPK
jgi:hypothetical protein